MPKYNQLQADRYSDTAFLVKQVTKKDQKLDNAWNHINYHPNMASNTLTI